MTLRREHALELARRGWRVFPLATAVAGVCSCTRGVECGKSAGKHPLIQKWQIQATTDAGQIRQWWYQWPEANIGLACGAESGLVVLDVDPERGGEESLRERPPLPETVEALTGGGGRHLLFRHPGTPVRNRQSWGELPGVDVRGDGGYIVAPGSVHRSGREYVWELSSHPDDVPVAPLPGWLRELLAADAGRADGGEERVEGSGWREADARLGLAAVLPVLQGCGWLRHCVEDAATLGEGAWKALADLCVRLEDGEQWFHQWSQPHPDYDPAAAQRKFEYARAHSPGPPTCGRIQQLDGAPYCATCVHRGRVGGPAGLARGRKAGLTPPGRVGSGQAAVGSGQVAVGTGEGRGAAGSGVGTFVEGGEWREPPHPGLRPPLSGFGEGLRAAADCEFGGASANGVTSSSASARTSANEGRDGPSELGLARRWAEEAQGRWAFFEGTQWYHYSSFRWQYSSAERAEAELQHWLEGLQARGERVTVTSTKVANVLRLARNHLGPHQLTELNARPTWIPLRNGVYDTETGELIPHSPSHFLTNQLPFDYLPGARCPRWQRFIREVLLTTDGQPCEEWMRALQEWYGYCLVPDNRAQVAMVWVGEGQNGKGVATRVLQHLSGPSQCCSVPIDQLHDPYHRAELHGKLVGFVDEPDPRALLKNGAHFKAITGEDTISARRPTEKVFTFVPYCRLIISCNAIPVTRDFSRGFFRRLLIVEWRYEVPREARDASLANKLREELPGIFNWAMEGLRRFRERGSEFEELPESERLLREYQLHEDTLEQFLQWECERGEDYRVPFATLYEAYRGWCQTNGFPRMESSTRIGVRLGKLGFRSLVTTENGASVRVRCGLRLARGRARSVPR